MHSDIQAMHHALRGRNFAPEQIWTLEGGVGRELVLAFLDAAREHIAAWSAGDVFLYYSGHGAYWPWNAETVEQARPAMKLDPDGSYTPRGAPVHGADRWLLWDEAFAALQLPPGVRLTVLPDC